MELQTDKYFIADRTSESAVHIDHSDCNVILSREFCFTKLNRERSGKFQNRYLTYVHKRV